jgi:hypothetical protein
MVTLKMFVRQHSIKNYLRTILFIGICLASSPFTFGETLLQGSVLECHIDKARQAAFEKLTPKMDFNSYSKVDPDKFANQQSIEQNQLCLPDREIQLFSDGSYAVLLYGKYFIPIYPAKGKVKLISIVNRPLGERTYPAKAATYSFSKGKLVFLQISLAKREDYQFELNGQLIRYCQGDICYKPDGSIYSYRHISEACSK